MPALPTDAAAPRAPGLYFSHMADSPVDRRAFFSEGFRRILGKAVEVVEKKVLPGQYVRPPGALPEPAFLGACTRCGECTIRCPVHAISVLGPETGLASGTPVIRPELTACVMCLDMPCAAHCPTDALTVPADGWRHVKMARIAIDTDTCIAYDGQECGVCARVCPAGEAAISLNEMGQPSLGAACTGCGTCIIACVTSPKSITATPAGILS
jgi:ferredoxin-type protein NapG